MFSNNEISKILFLDIETVRATKTYEELPEGLQTMWDLKATHIKADPEISPEEKYYDKAGIFAEFGKVVCISFGFVHWVQDTPKMKIKSFFGEDESKVLGDFKNLLNQKFQGWRLCAHNGKEFDFPYLCRRYLINQIPLPEMLRIQGKKPWEIPFLDTMELWRFGDYKNYTKLELLCHVFGIPSPKDTIDGSQVGRVFWEEDGVAEIARYCEKDVVATIQLFMKYACMPLIDEQYITVSDL